MIALSTCLLLLLGTPALAHGLGETGDGPTWTLGRWTFDPGVLSLLLASGGLYLSGTVRLWQRAGFGRGIGAAQAACFWTGWLCAALALISPLHWFSERVFVAHMAEHTLLIAVAAPLIALGCPTRAAAWGSPKSVSTGIAHLLRHRAMAALWRGLTDPFVATAVQGIVLWMWHMPRLYDLALGNLIVHRLQHLSFSLAAVLFWWALLRARRPGVAVFCLFVTALHTSLLGLLLTLSTRLWYPPQVEFVAAWGLAPLEDQQLAGLVMWVPMGVIYTIAGLWFAARWITSTHGDIPLRMPAASERPV